MVPGEKEDGIDIDSS